MPASRLSDGQRAEMVERFRRGVATVQLADAYGCSPNTVSRLVRAAMDEEEYERLKRLRQRRSGGSEPAGPEGLQPEGLSAAPEPLTLESAASIAPQIEPQLHATAASPVLEEPQQPVLPGLLEASSTPDRPHVDEDLGNTLNSTRTGQPNPANEALPLHPAADQAPPASASQPSPPSPPRPASDPPRQDIPATDHAPAEAADPVVGPGTSRRSLGIDDSQDAEPGVLAIEDADDFGDDDDELSEDDPEFGDDSLPLEDIFQPVPLLEIGMEPSPIGALAWRSASLPSSAYMLVEKTVELQPQLLRELPELGQLPEDEQERQALVLYVNPRQAKRQCGRNQRVIRIPDTQVFELTATKLAAQGITRVVVEGSLFALPGC